MTCYKRWKHRKTMQPSSERVTHNNASTNHPRFENGGILFLSLEGYIDKNQTLPGASLIHHFPKQTID
jgi:hypothetical protein